MKRVLAFLRGLAVYRFALMLGCGIVGTVMAAWLVCIIAYAVWPEAAAIPRVEALGAALLAVIALIALVLCGVAFGKLDKLSVKAGLVEAELDFDDDEKPSD